MVREERQHFVAHDRIVGRLARDPALDAGVRVAIERRLEQIAHAAMLVGRHDTSPLSSRNNHARAIAQRRLSVAGDMPIASAVSSMLSPAKYRSSTMRACSAS